MGKKKDKPESAKVTFDNSPFRSLKGFAVSAAAEEKEPPAAVEQPPPAHESVDEFASAMDLLGVQPLEAEEDQDAESCSTAVAEKKQPSAESTASTEDDAFLSAMGELGVHFTDRFPEDDDVVTKASPRRMKLLKQGRIKPQASCDLHGCRGEDVAVKLKHFFDNARYQGLRTLLVITGKGLHSSSGEAVLRSETERYLRTEALNLVAEWGQAPRAYGGSGALIIFLKKNR